MSHRKNKNTGLIKVGITTDNKPVISGIYKFYETHGLPLDIIFDIFIRKEWVPDWISLYQDALAAGMQHDRILSKLEEAINDSFGKEWAAVVIFRLDNIFAPKEEK